MILVAGGTGTLGTRLLPLLADRGLDVRILSRKHGKAPPLLGDRVKILDGDVRDPRIVEQAMVGVRTVISAITGFGMDRDVNPRTVDWEGNENLIRAAKTAGVEHFILLSVCQAGPDHPIELFRMKHVAEEHLRGSGAPWTIVRATAFAEFWLDLLDQTAAASGRPVIFGRGANPINFVSVADVAALAERAVVDPSTRGATFEIGGPQNLSFNELAAGLQRASKRTATARHVPRAILRLLAAVLRPVQPNRARQIRAAIAMDSIDLTFMATDLHRRFPELPVTSLADILAHRSADSGDERPPALRPPHR